MQELIDHLTQKAGLTPEQATQAINAIKDYVKQKFPMLEGAMENMFGSQAQAGTDGSGASGLFDNIAGKAEEALNSLKGKFNG